MKRSICATCGRKIKWTEDAYRVDSNYYEWEPIPDFGWRHMGLQDKGFNIDLFNNIKADAVYCGFPYDQEVGYAVACPPVDPLASLCASLDGLGES